MKEGDGGITIPCAGNCAGVVLTPLEWQALPPQQYSPDDLSRIERSLDEAYARGFRPNEIRPFFSLAAIRTAPEMEHLQRQATARMAELSRSYAAALDAAALLLLAHGCHDIARVLQPNGVDELWIDAAADRARVGEVMPGRCVYRQRMRADEGIVTEWLDSALAAAAQAVRP